MPNWDYDREDRNDKRDNSRARLFESLEETPNDRFRREPSDGGYPPIRKPYSDRAPLREDFLQRPRETASFADYGANGNVTITTPKSYKDVQGMIDNLKRNESIIVNLEGIESDSAQRILDFLSGAAYALGGSMRRVKEMHSTFLVTPQGTGITDTNDDRYSR